MITAGRSRRRVVRLLCCCLLLALLPPMARPATARSETWVAFGDSLTASQNWPWTELIERATGHTVINSGINYNNTDQALKVLETDVIAHHPDLVLIMFGVNDQRIRNGGRPDGYAVPPERYARNLEQMIRRIQETGAKVVLMTNRPLIEGPSPTLSLYFNRNGDRGTLYTLPRKTKDSIQLYNDIVRRLAARYGTGLVDIWQAVVDRAGGDSDADLRHFILERPGPYLDGVHLGPDGARFYARTILQALGATPPPKPER